MSNAIKRYKLLPLPSSGLFPSEVGGFCAFTDHEADKAEAIAAKDAEILVLKNAVRIVESRYQSIAEQVRERLIHRVQREHVAVSGDQHEWDMDAVANHNASVRNCVDAIRTADLTDLQNLVAASVSPGSEDVRATVNDMAAWLASPEGLAKMAESLARSGATVEALNKARQVDVAALFTPIGEQ
jgi:hypothetical protein